MELANMNTIKWKDFLLSDLFPNITRGTRLTQYEREPGKTPLVTAGYQNEGVADFISNSEQERFRNTITIDMFCNVFYRDYTFCCDDNILVINNFNFSQNVGLFLSVIIGLDKYRFAYGRQYRKKDYQKHVIKLPVDENGNPDWNYMDGFISDIQSRERESGEPIKNSNKTINKTNQISVNSSWDYFRIGDLFNCVLSKGDLKEPECSDGKIPLISSGDSNNGCVKFIDESGDGKAEIFEGNCLTLDMFCKAYYQDSNFYSVSHGRVNILKPKFEFDKYIGLFIATVINNERFRFSYGRAVYSTVAENMQIKLPSINGKPDLTFMRNYIKSLPFADRI